MFGKWFSRPANGASESSQTSSDSRKSQLIYKKSDITKSYESQINIDNSTIILRADPQTLLMRRSGADRKLSNRFDIETIALHPSAAFDNPFDVSTKLMPLGCGSEKAASVADEQSSDSLNFDDLPLPIGSVLNSRYEVIKPIGRGGFSYVYHCQHRKNGRLIAVKEAFGANCIRVGSDVVATDRGNFGQITESILREISAISKINNPGIVQLEEVFQANGTIYFAMNFIEGESLSSLLARRRGLSEKTFNCIATSLLDAVEVLHRGEILHGDIKPSNIIVRPDKSVVLIDFGSAARLADMEYMERTLTPGYSAPERYFVNGDVGAWSDVYSCAITLVAAMAGTPPPQPVSNGHPVAGMDAFLRSARDSFPNCEHWIEGAKLALDLDVQKRPQSIAGLRDAMGIAARAVAASPTEVAGPGRGDGRSVFISYAHGDAAVVEALVRSIQRRGAGVWIDRQGIKAGSRAWGEEILNGMRGAQIVLVFSSARSMASDNVKDEIYLARQLRKPIVVARLDESPINEEVLMFLIRSQHIITSEMDPLTFAERVVALLSSEQGR